MPGLEETLGLILGLIIGLTIHEFSHAWVADRLGDPTARLQGRLSLNPLAHLDPIGTLMLIFFRFGWGKPVPVDPYNLADPRKDSALISLAGPASNFILATLIALIFFRSPLLPVLENIPGLPVILFIVAIININLSIFNLLPVPPLDGAKIFAGILPAPLAALLLQMEQFGFILLLMLLLIFPDFLASTFIPLSQTIQRLLFGVNFF